MSDGAIHQIVPCLRGGDAISNHVLWIRETLRGFGYHSTIYAEHASPEVAHEVQIIGKASIASDAALLYHHCTGTSLAWLAGAHPGPRALLYHNITPPEYFRPYNPELARIQGAGRAELPKLARLFPVSCGDSAYNVQELREAGFINSRVLPIPVSPDRWSGEPDHELMVDLHDGRTNIVYVGRTAPHKGLDHLIEAFYHYLCMDSSARLLLPGMVESADPYVQFLRDRINQLGIGSRVSLLGHVDEAGLQALYRSADLFWSMSEHEGFCVPLLEAMWFDIPVLAYHSSAVPETLGEAGVIFTDKTDLRSVAALAKLLVHDQTLRQHVIAAQRRRRQDFLPDLIRPHIADLAARLLRVREAAA